MGDRCGRTESIQDSSKKVERNYSFVCGNLLSPFAGHSSLGDDTPALIFHIKARYHAQDM